MSSKMNAYRVTPAISNSYSWQEWDQYVESCKFNTSCFPFTTDSVCIDPELKSNEVTENNIFDIGTYSGRLSHFAKIEEKDFKSAKHVPMIHEESTKVEDKSEIIDPLSDLKSNDEDQFFSSKFCSLSNDNCVYQDDQNFECMNENLNSETERTVEQNFTYPSEEINDESIDFHSTKRGKVKQQIRWRKEDDKMLFQSLTEALKTYDMDFNEFCCYSLKQYKPPILSELLEKTGWKGSSTAFIQRIIKLYNLSTKLSVRELKKLRKEYYIIGQLFK